MTRRRSSVDAKVAEQISRDRGGTTPGALSLRRAARRGLAPSSDRLRPWLLMAAVALWVARPLYPSESSALEGDGLPAVMLWLILVLIWLFGAIRQSRPLLRFGWVDVAFLATVIWHTLSAIWWAGRASPRPAVNMLWEWVGFAAGFFLTRQLLTGPRECRALMAVMCGLAVAVAAFGGYQYVYDLPATRAAYAEDPDQFLANAGLWLPPGSPEREVFEKRLASVEPIGTFALANSLAGLLAPWLVVFAGLLILGRTESKKGSPRLASVLSQGDPSQSGVDRSHVTSAATRRVAWGSILRWLSLLAGATIVAICLLLTKSRSAYMAVAFGVVLVGWMWRGGNRRLPGKAIAGAAVMAVVVLAAAYTLGGLDREVLTEAWKSLGYRGQYWQSSLAMIADHPVLGCGPGNFQFTYTAYKLPEASEEIADPHNFLMEIWATAGTPAMLAFVAALAGFFVAMVREPVPSRDGSPPGDGNAAGTVSNEAERPGLVYVGAALGFLLALPLSAISPAPPKLPFFLVTLPCLAVTLAALWKWVQNGECPRGLAAVGVTVLLIHLSASGGIGFGGVAGSLWLLMAIGLNLADGGKMRPLPKGTGWVVLLVVGGAAWACYTTAYGPVLRFQSALQRAERRPLQADQHLIEAAQADPWAIQPWNQLAALAFEVWKKNPHDEKATRRFLGYTENLLAIAPKCASFWEMAGERFSQMFNMTQQRQYLQQAEKCFQTAVTLYPNSATLRAKLALTLRAVGNVARYQEERLKALELDQITPHLDKKLTKELQQALNRN